MPRQVLTKTTAEKSGWPTAGVAVTFTAANVTDKEQFPLTGKEIVIARNSGASSRTITITSVAFNGRVGHITAESIAAGAVRVYGPFNVNGWQQTDGNLYLEANHAEVLFAVIALP